MKNVFLFSVLISLIMFCSCESDDSKNLNTFSVDANCVLSSVPVERPDDECAMNLNTDASCEELLGLDTLITLSDDQKKWFPWFCLEKDQKIYFSDEKGNEIYLTLAIVLHDFSQNSFVVNDVCESEERSVTCLNRERIYFSLKNSEFRISVVMEKEFSSVDSESEQFENAQLSIYRSPISDIIGNVEKNTMLIAEINDNGLLDTCCPLILPTNGAPGIADSLFQKTYDEEITLNDRTFKEVISVDFGEGIDESSKYSAIDGLVAFTDDQGTLWIQN